MLFTGRTILNLLVLFSVFICTISFRTTSESQLNVTALSDSLKCFVEYKNFNIFVKNPTTNEIIENGSTIPVDGRIIFACYPGFFLKGYNTTRCNKDGTWTKNFPICFKFCSGTHPKSGFSTVATFQYDGYDVSSSDAFEPGTIATISCAQGYYPKSYFHKELTCTEIGWIPDKYPCYMRCGRLSPPIQQYSLGGVPASTTEMPWHVGVYNRTENAYRNICGGTIISPRLVISAAPCFLDPQKPLTDLKVDPTTFKIAAGKLYREYDSEEPTPILVQKRDISEIWIHPDYKGRDNGYYLDTAIIKLAEFLVFSDMVRPICLDFPQDQSQGIHSEVKGYFSAFNQLSTYNPKSSLQRLDMSTLSHDDCENELKKSNSSLTNLSSDKFCVVSYGDSYGCRGDAGSGFVIYNETTDQYFLRGIISFSPRRTLECDVNGLLALTNPLYYPTFLKNYWLEDIRNDIKVLTTV